MRMIGVLKLATLVLLLGNLATIHHPAVSNLLGPLHGLAYTVSLIVAVLVSHGRHGVWLLALVPGIGGLLAARSR